MKNELILMSHGMMAKEMLNSAKMILGDQIDYPVVCMSPEDGINGTKAKLVKILEQISGDKKIIILADLMGGTPANVASMAALEDSRISVVTGMNLGMILESFFSLEEEYLEKKLIEIGIQGILKPQVQETEDE
ncbi:PTS system, mannose/fructose/sorbose family, IIA component [Enterococcus phoeniculicola]|jgi:PTS system mannose-specific IIA component|uniref:PTS system, mannose/fructose/sorbose family, IIA component n=1 Tax=Enterococcus phoeniculicola ATCC BAA-412 TaxID=1158610 RepID=R3U4D2_9ENTE|nr:PTS sugar transporter subunit IIA [Enterococcus phoeniculicola]EOL48804.1 PTS system, mannose/fructose/sorbose family, IIA component [Enterococcus phoeniculicola ATCC BAA-412]EOT72650.1 PTS system IIA component [Enterococcus phoeniculicola ATCC BAA-412]OJG71924.1 PTS system, mannose/fructose/sorbose family, IIA component [Enterococcus phoeniculicola]